MESFPAPAQLNGAKLAEELQTAGWECDPISDIILVGDELQVTVSGSGTTPVADVVAAHTGGLSTAQVETQDWRTRLAEDIAWLENEVATAPAQGTTTSGNAVARLDALIQHVKRVDRGLLRLARFVRDHELDTGQ